LVIENFHGLLQSPLRGGEIVPPLEGRGIDEFVHNISQTHFKNQKQKPKPKPKQKKLYSTFTFFSKGVGNRLFSNQNDKVDTKYFSNPNFKQIPPAQGAGVPPPPGRVDQQIVRYKK
jgi:hypothetical protein